MKIRFTKKTMSILAFAGILLLGGFGLGNVNNVNNLTPDSKTIFSQLENEQIKQIKRGANHSAALSNTGNVYTWGQNLQGELGDGTFTNNYTPTKITDNFDLSEGEKIIELSLGHLFSLALTNQGSLFSWGHNEYGQLGAADASPNKSTPTNITKNFGFRHGSDEHIKSISAGYYHSAALTNKGDIYTWGMGGFGQVGNSKLENTNKPFMLNYHFPTMVGGEDITQINMGQYHSSALTNHGTVYTWGDNSHGQLGNNTIKTAPKPIEIDNFAFTGNEKIIQLDLGGEHSGALTDDGNIYTWGRNDRGQIGNGTTNDRHFPEWDSITDHFKSLGDKEKVLQISMGPFSSSAVTNKGNVYTWGSNHYGELGNDSTEHSSFPIKITIEDLSKGEQITQLSSGIGSMAAVTNKGNVYTWGMMQQKERPGENVKIPGQLDFYFDSVISFAGISDIETTSVRVNFTVVQNDANGIVIIRNSVGEEVVRKNNVNGPDSILLTGLKSNTEFTGWTIEVDGDGEITIPTFQTKPILSNILSFNVTNETLTSVTINFNVAKNDQDGNVVIKDDTGTKQGSKNNVNGDDKITITNLKSGTTFTAWTIEVDGNDKTIIPSFTTKTPKPSVITFNGVSNETATTVIMNFEVEKNDQEGNVVIRDDNNNERGNKNGVNGKGVIIIDELDPNTTFTKWTIEVDENPKTRIPEFKTKKETVSSNITFKGVTNETSTSVQMNFNVTKNDHDGNVIIKDDSGTERAKQNGVNGDAEIIITNLTSGTTFSEWTIEVDGNDKTTIPPFTTKTAISSDITNVQPKNINETSADISFDLQINDGKGLVKIFDDNSMIKSETLTSGKQSIKLENLSENTIYDKLTISVDEGPKKDIPTFETTFFNHVIENSIKLGDVTTNSVIIDFQLETFLPNSSAEVNIWNNDQKIHSNSYKSGSQSIKLNDLKSNEEYNLWISVDEQPKEAIGFIKTDKYSSNDIQQKIKIIINDKVNIKDSDKIITLTYLQDSQEALSGTGYHIITYKNGEEQKTPILSSQYSNNSTQHTYILDQSIENIDTINTIYEIDGYQLILGSYSGTKNKIFGDSNIKSGLLSISTIIAIALTITIGIILIIFLISFFIKRKNKHNTKIKIKQKPEYSNKN